MKIKNTVSIIIIAVLCMEQANAQKANEVLSRNKAGNYEATNSIQSTQTLTGESTSYVAGNQIVLKPGFGFRATEGSEFVATIANPSNCLTMMTYNLWVESDMFSEHVKTINNSGADVIAIQEMKGTPNFNNLKKATGLEGEFYVLKGDGWAIFEWIIPDYGIALLWKPSMGTPTIAKKKIDIPDKNPDKGNRDGDKERGYITAIFPDFCFISTHYSLNKKQRIEMTGKILSDVEFLALIEKLSKKHIPVYVAGDLNEEDHDEPAIKNFTDYGFEILNMTNDFDPDYKHATKGITYLDLILEYNTNPNHATLNRGIPHLEPFGGRQPVEWLGNVSDHYPYLVKVKLK